MQFKKSLLLLNLILSSFSTYAGVTITNYTNEEFAVVATTTPKDFRQCFNLNPAAQKTGTPIKFGDNAFGIVCRENKKDICLVDVFNNSYCTNKVGHAVVSLNSKQVLEVQSTDSRYVFTLDSGNQIQIKYIA